jgi:hypothetical protein
VGGQRHTNLLQPSNAVAIFYLLPDDSDGTPHDHQRWYSATTECHILDDDATNGGAGAVIWYTYIERMVNPCNKLIDNHKNCPLQHYAAAASYQLGITGFRQRHTTHMTYNTTTHVTHLLLQHQQRLLLVQQLRRYQEETTGKMKKQTCL